MRGWANPGWEQNTFSFIVFRLLLFLFLKQKPNLLRFCVFTLSELHNL